MIGEHQNESVVDCGMLRAERSGSARHHGTVCSGRSSGTGSAAAPDDATSQAAAGDPAPPPPEPVPHLLSPENLPPGTTDVPVEPQGGLCYLRDIWHAMQTQDVTFSEALFLLAQRPLNPNAAPPPGLSAHPQPLPEPLPAEPPPAEPPPGPPANPQPLPAEPLPPPPPE